MSYVDAISNALAAKGNALAQGELQRGAVYGNLARNLGEIPGQAIAFHQQREAAMQNNELKKIAIEKAQRTADREKRAIQIVNSGKPKDQIYAELKMLASEDPEDFLKFQHAESQLAIQQQHLNLDIAQKDFTQKSGLPGTEFKNPIVPQPQNNALGVGGPPIPVPQRQMEFERMVHPMNALGNRPPTDVDIRERTAATDALAMTKFSKQQDILETDREELARVKAGLLKDKPENLQGAENYVEWKSQEHKRVTGQDATPGQKAAWWKEGQLFSAQFQARQQGGDLTPEALDMAAILFAKTGQLPAMGMGGAAGLRQKIINQAAKLSPGADLAANKAEYGADKGSLTALTKNRDAVIAFENTALKNLEQFQKTAKPLIDSGSPLINIPLRQASSKVMGSAEVAAFDAARRVAINEIAKVVSNPNLTGQLSDSARREVESFIPEQATLKQINAVANILKTDMQNRHQSLDEQLKEIRTRLGSVGGGGGGSSAESKPEFRFDPRTRKTVPVK